MNLGDQELQFLSRLAAEGKTIISTAEAELEWKGSTSVSLVLHRLEKKGWLQRVDRGVYLIVPLEAGPDRLWTESQLIIASHLVNPAAVAYWSALHYWQMTEQIPLVTFVQSTKRKKPVKFQGTQFQFVTVKEGRFFGITERQLNHKNFTITDREKTLLDCADRLDLSGGIVQLYQAIESNYNQVDWDTVDEYFKRWGGGTVVKRIGYLVDYMAIPVPERALRLTRWKGLLTKGISLLEPGAGTEGPIVTSWNIRVNIQNLPPYK